MSETLAQSDLLPKTFQGKPANIMMAMNMAERMKADPFMVMQSMHVVHGKPGFSAAFCIALLGQSGLITHFSTMWMRTRQT